MNEDKKNKGLEDKLNNLKEKIVQLEQDNIELRAMLEKAMDTLHVGVTIADTNGKIIYSNPAEAKMHGYELDEMIGKDVEIFAAKGFRKPINWHNTKRINKRIRETYNKRKDGTTFPVQLISDLIKNDEGEPLAVVTVSENITKRKNLEQALQESKGNFERLLEISPSPILIHDMSSIINVNQKGIEFFGYAKEEILSMPPEDIIHPDSRDDFMNWTEQLIKENIINGEKTLSVLTKQLEKKEVEVSTGLIQIHDKTVILSILNVK